jgi:hypothetical protein
MTTSVKYALTFVVEINDRQALQAFNESRRQGHPGEFVDDHERVVLASFDVIAEAFTKLKPETGLQLRSVMIVD